MKHTFTFFAVLMMALALPQVAKAYDFSAVAPSGQTLYYNIDNGGAVVTYPNHRYGYYDGIVEPTGSLVIPDSVTYNSTTYAVINIRDHAFDCCDGLTAVTIPNSVTSIGDYAFYHCDGLMSVTIGNSVTSIGHHSFHYCSGLTSVTIPNLVTSIGDYSFYYCSGLLSVIIGNSVTSIGDYSFYYCSGLTSVTIPNSVTSIGNYSFYYCSGLTSVIIGNSVTSIGSDAFSGCNGLSTVSFTGTIEQWCSMNFENGSSNPTYHSHFLNNNGIPIINLVIPDGITEIKQYAFILIAAIWPLCHFPTVYLPSAARLSRDAPV